ncbi:MAG TPA: hypothetical protein VIN59_04260 [Alphaproteobacteria bacterium]
MPKRLKLMVLVMLLAFIALACAIEYADRHPLNDAQIESSRGR